MKLNGLVGGGTGKLGNSVFSQNAGRTIVRQYVSEVKNPNSVRQQYARMRFRVFTEFSKGVASIIVIGMPRLGALTSRNRLAKLMLSMDAPYGSAISGDLEYGMEVDVSSVILAKGGMPKPAVADPTVPETGHTFTVSLTENYDPTAQGYIPAEAGQAGVVIAAYEPSTKTSVVLQSSTVTAGSLTVTAPPSMYGQRVHIFAFAKWIPESHTEVATTDIPWRYPSDQSDSVYVGTVTINA